MKKLQLRKNTTKLALDKYFSIFSFQKLKSNQDDFSTPLYNCYKKEIHRFLRILLLSCSLTVYRN